MSYPIFKADPPSSKSGGAKYPLSRMRPGDAFRVPNDRGYDKSGHSCVAATLRVAVNYYRANHEPLARFTVRTEGDRVTVYRLADGAPVQLFQRRGAA